MKDCIEQNFLKKRYIFRVSLKEFEIIKKKKLYDENLSNEYKIEFLNEGNYMKYIDFLTLSNSLRKINERITNKNFIGVVLLNSDNEAIGYLWSLGGARKAIWHDSFKIGSGDFLLINTYISPLYRGKRLAHYLKFKMYVKIFCENPTAEVFNVVERKNKNSLISNLKLNSKAHSQNFLIKILKRNILSIYKEKSVYKIFILFRKRKNNY